MATAKKTASGKWKIQIKVGDVRENETFATKALADEWAVDRARQLKLEAKQGPGAVKTLREALQKYSEEESPKNKGKAWEQKRIAAFLGDHDEHPMPFDVPVGKLKSSDFDTWVTHREELVQAGTVRRDLSLLGSVFKAARERWRWIESNPLANLVKPAVPEHRDRVISNLEIRRMLRGFGWKKGVFETQGQRCAAAFLLSLFTGMRAKEICTLKWDQVKQKSIFLPLTKTTKRSVGMTLSALKLLERLRGVDEKFVLGGLKTTVLSTLFARTRKQNNVCDEKEDNFRFHDARHTAATNLAQVLDVLDLCKSFGWSNPKQAMTYYNPTGESIGNKLIAAELAKRRNNGLRLAA